MTTMEFYVPDRERIKATERLHKFFKEELCQEIERGFYEYVEQFCTSVHYDMSMAPAIYKDCIQNFMYNCGTNNRTISGIISNVNEGKYNPYNLAFLRPEELNEDNWIKIIMRRNTTEEKLKNLPSIKWHPCKRCKGTDYVFYQLQTRSADEPITTFYICKECGWTKSINN